MARRSNTIGQLFGIDKRPDRILDQWDLVGDARLREQHQTAERLQLLSYTKPRHQDARLRAPQRLHRSPLHEGVGILLSDQRRYKEAIQKLVRATALPPDLARAHYRLAQAYQRTGQEALAAKELEIFERLSKNPSSPP